MTKLVWHRHPGPRCALRAMGWRCPRLRTKDSRDTTLRKTRPSAREGACAPDAAFVYPRGLVVGRAAGMVIEELQRSTQRSARGIQHQLRGIIGYPKEKDMGKRRIWG